MDDFETPNGSDDDEIIKCMSPRDRERLQLMIKVKSKLISSPRDKELSVAISHFIQSVVTAKKTINPEGCIFGVVGASGAGKSVAIRRVLDELSEPLKKSLLCIKAPHPCTQKQLALTILEELNYYVQRDVKENMAWRMARTHLERNRIRILWIDEMHNAIHSRSEVELNRVSETIKR